MNISYQYEVTSVDLNANCMEVVFRSDGLQDVTVGVRIPFEGEDVDAVIRSFAPATVWQPNVTPHQEIQVGYAGSFQAFEVDPNAAANEIAAMQREFEKSVAKVLVKFGVLQSDPTAIQVTEL